MAGDQGALAEAGELTEEQLKEAERLMAEMPRIDTALKTYLSLRLAEMQTGATVSASAADLAALQGCARVVSKTVNTLAPPNSLEWGKKHPQLETESGLEYMARIGNYKVVHALWTHARGKGQKPTQLLGRSALQVMLPQIQDQILVDTAASAQSAKASEDQLRDFLDGFCAASAPQGDVNKDAEPGAPDGELVWSVDYRASLAARQLARKSEATERVGRQASAGTLVEEMKSALARSAQDSGAVAGSSVQIEEVD